MGNGHFAVVFRGFWSDCYSIEVTHANELLEHPWLRDVLSFVGGDPQAGPIRRVSVLDHLAAVENVDTDSICVCTSSASDEVDTYRLDLAIRTGANRGVRAFIFKRSEGESLGPTGPVLAQRGNVALLVTPKGTDTARLVGDLLSALEGGLADVIAGARVLVEDLEEYAVEEDPDIERWARRAGSLLGRSVRINDLAARLRVDVDIEDDRSLTFCADRESPDSDVIVELALRSLADAAARATGRQAPALDRPIASVIAELILADRESDQLVTHAEQLGYRVGAWHAVTHFALDIDQQGLDPARRLAATHEIARRVARRVLPGHPAEGEWYPVGLVETITFAWNGVSPPTPARSQALRRAIEALIAAFEIELRPNAVWCGVGGIHQDLHGLRASAAEARAAMSHAQAIGTCGEPVIYDAIGLRRMLLDWTTTEASRRAFHRLLAPLSLVSTTKGKKLLETVISVFENQGSITATARHLGVHRNTVDARLKTAYDLLDLDPSDADHRLMLYLAARAYDQSR